MRHNIYHINYHLGIAVILNNIFSEKVISTMDNLVELDVSSYNIKQIKMEPLKIREKSYKIEIKYFQKYFYIQSPLCTIQNIIYTSDENNISNLIVLFKIDKNFNYYKFFGGFDSQIFDYVNEFSLKHRLISKENIQDLFHSAWYQNDDKTKIIINLKVNQETKYFDKNKNIIHGLELNIGDKIIGLLTTKGIFIDEKGINYRWTGKQILKYK